MNIIEITALKKTLEKLGIEGTKLEKKEGNIYLLSILKGFKVFKNKNGDEAILQIDNFEIQVTSYTAPYLRKNGEIKKLIFLAPVS